MPQPNSNQSTGAATKDRTGIDEPRQYKVVVHNDDFTTIEFVADMFVRVFSKPADEAMALTMKIHREGKAVAGVFSYDVAMTKAHQAMALARDSGYPLRLTCEPD